MKNLDYITDIIDRYANKVGDGSILSTEQRFQLFECVVNLNRMSDISEETREKWVGLAHETINISN